MTELLENSYSIIKSDQMFSWKPLPGAGNSRAQRGQPGLHCLAKMFMMHFSLSQTLSKCLRNHHNRNISARPRRSCSRQTTQNFRGESQHAECSLSWLWSPVKQLHISPSLQDAIRQSKKHVNLMDGWVLSGVFQWWWTSWWNPPWMERQNYQNSSVLPFSSFWQALQQ